MTIYEALKAKLGREPSHAELCDEVKRILKEAIECPTLIVSSTTRRPARRAGIA